MTIAEQIRAEVHEFDIPERLRKILRKLLALRFGHAPSADQEQVIESGSNEQLDLWIERVLTAASIDEVLS